MRALELVIDYLYKNKYTRGFIRFCIVCVLTYLVLHGCIALLEVLTSPPVADFIRAYFVYIAFFTFCIWLYSCLIGIGIWRGRLMADYRSIEASTVCGHASGRGRIECSSESNYSLNNLFGCGNASGADYAIKGDGAGDAEGYGDIACTSEKETEDYNGNYN